MKIVIAAVMLVFCSSASYAQEKITPSHVYQKAQQIIAEIEDIRAAENIVTTPREPGVQTNKRPLHVYSKSLEVIEKIGRYQDIIGIKRVATTQIPIRKVTPSEVYEQAESILVELSRIREAQGLQYSPKQIPFIKGKGPSDVYELMWKSSYLLDALAGQTSPNEVFRNTQYILKELELIADKLDVDIGSRRTEPLTGPKSPKDVNLEAFKTLHKIGRIQRYLDVEPFSPSPFPAGKIFPNDALDSTNTILAELVRLKVALGINAVRENQPIPSGKNPGDVFKQMLKVSARLAPILAATSSRKPAKWADVAVK